MSGQIGSITITLSADEADKLSLQLSDLLCWASGFEAARAGTEISGHTPYGIEAARTLNIKLKSALNTQTRN